MRQPAAPEEELPTVPPITELRSEPTHPGPLEHPGWVATRPLGGVGGNAPRRQASRTRARARASE